VDGTASTYTKYIMHAKCKNFKREDKKKYILMNNKNVLPGTLHDERLSLFSLSESNTVIANSL